MWSCSFRWVLFFASSICPVEMASLGRIYTERIRPSSGVKTWLYTERGWNGRQWEGVVLLWYPLGWLQLSICAKIFHSSAFLFKMPFCQFSGESTQFRMLPGATHSIVQQWQLFEMPPAELWGSIQNMSCIRAQSESSGVTAAAQFLCERPWSLAPLSLPSSAVTQLLLWKCLLLFEHCWYQVNKGKYLGSYHTMTALLDSSWSKPGASRSQYFFKINFWLFCSTALQDSCMKPVNSWCLGLPFMYRWHPNCCYG